MSYETAESRAMKRSAERAAITDCLHALAAQARPEADEILAKIGQTIGILSSFQILGRYGRYGRYTVTVEEFQS